MLPTGLVPVAVLWGVLLAAAAAGAAERTCAAAGEVATVQGVNERSELTLVDGRVVRLAGIAIPSPDAAGLPIAAAARAALAEWLAGRQVSVRPVLPTPDRWDRVVADVFAPTDFSQADADPPMSAAAVLVDAGLARVTPAPETQDCGASLLAAEDEARRDGLGLWADPYYAVVDAADVGRLAERAGTFLLVEGKVTRVGYGRSRTYVNFGATRESFTITIPKRSVRTFEAAGLAPARLTGMRLRVRGVLDTRFGPQIEIDLPSAVERL